MLAPEQLAQIRGIFGQSDQDGSGAIDTDEFRTLLEDFGVFKSDEEMEVLMEQMGAGTTGSLSFVQLVQRAPQWLLIKYVVLVVIRSVAVRRCSGLMRA